MLFEKRLRDGLTDGSIRVAFRRWRRPQVVVGHRYRLGAAAGVVPVTRVDLVDSIVDEDVRVAGFASREELLRDVGEGDGQLYRVEFGAVEADPRDALRVNEDVGGLQARVGRIAQAREILEAIQRQPGTRAAELAEQLGWPELLKFKLQVRRLKALGLTISLERGYRLSARGEAFLEEVNARRG